MATLFDRLGGAPAIEKAVDVFYNKVMADHRINHWFSHMDMHAQRKKQSTFLTTALGGPSTYSGRDMAAAHQALVDRGLGDADFDAVVENLASTLTELGIDASLIGEVATLLESQRDTVLCRNHPRSLYDRLGGAPAIEKAVDVFYNKVMADHRINHWFSHMDMHAQRKKQSTFLTTALGGPSTYSGRDMAAAHQALVDRGLGDADFDAVVENLASTLTELGIDASLIGEVATLLESQRDTVLCRNHPPTLFDRLGGAPAIEKAVDVFYNKVMADHRINHWFSHMDMHAQRKKQSTFLTTALGGPSTYSGRDMAAAHQALVDRGLGDADFDAVVENLASTLTELGIDASLIGEVATLLESQRDTVLCRTGNPLIHSVFSDGVLRADQWSKFRLVARSDLAPATNGSPGTILLTFAVAGEQPTVFAPGQHVQVGAEINGRWVLRNYTPMPPYERPEIKLAVKVYPNGAMSSHLAALPIGAAVELRGPRGHYTYQRGSVGRANMLACGSGVMPVYQLLHAVAAESDAHMPARILYANRNEEVAILKEELSSLVHTRPHFELQYYLTHPTDRCRVKYLPHRIDSASIASSCFEPDATTCNFISGTDDFVRSMRDILTEQGHRPESIVIF